MKVRNVGIALFAGSALLLSACGSNQETYQAVCVEPNSYTVVDDDYCEEDEDAYRGFPWVYVAKGTLIPRVGQAFKPGSFSKNLPKNTRADYGDVPSEGGVYSGSWSKPKPASTQSKPSTQASKPNAAPKAPAPKPAPKPAPRITVRTR